MKTGLLAKHFFIELIEEGLNRKVPFWCIGDESSNNAGGSDLDSCSMRVLFLVYVIILVGFCMSRRVRKADFSTYHKHIF